MTAPDPVEKLLRTTGGAARRSELVARVGRRAVDRALADGRIERHGRSWVALPDVHRGLVAALTRGGVLSGESAAECWGWQVKVHPRRPVIIVPDSRSRTRTGVDVVRRDLLPGEATGPVLTRAATVVDCARTLPYDAALAVADAALRSGTVRREDLFSEAARHRERWERAEQVILDATPLSAGAFESVARAIARDVPGLDVVPQGIVAGIGHGDLVDHALGIVIECDSWEFHSDREAFRYDKRRYTAMTLAGWIVVCLTWEDVMKHPERVRAQLTRAVTLARARTNGTHELRR